MSATSDQTSAFVSVADVTIRRRGRTVINEVSFSLPPTGLVLLGGENGTGKTTLLIALAGLRSPDVGSIRVDGHDLASATGRRAVGGRVAYMPQTPSCPRSFTVRDLVFYSAWLQKVPSAERDERASICLERVGLAGRLDERVVRLSGGEQRRAFLASAMVGHASVVLLDEPTVGLDAPQRVEVRRILQDMARDCAVVVSSHISEDFEHLADRILLLDRGRVVFDGPRAEFVAKGAVHGADVSVAEASFSAIVAEVEPE